MSTSVVVAKKLISLGAGVGVGGTGVGTKSPASISLCGRRSDLKSLLKHHNRVLNIFSTRQSSNFKGSYLHGIGAENAKECAILVGKTLGQCVDEATERYADDEAVVDCHQNIRKTFAQYRDDIDKLATGLLSLGLRRGDRLAIWSPNCYEWAVTQFASAKAGLIMATINPMFKSQEFEYCLKKLKIRAVIAGESFKEQNYYSLVANVVQEILQTKPGHRIKSIKHPYFDTLIMMTEKDLPGTLKYSDVLEAGGSSDKVRLQELDREIQFDDAVNIQFTSGTTGQPKAAVLSHHGIVNNALLIATNAGYFEHRAHICANVPMFHCFGCVGVTLVGLISGSCTVYPSPGFSASACLKAIVDEKCDAILGTPTMFVDILNHPTINEIDFLHVRTGIMAGALCPPDLIKRAYEKLNCKGIIIGYGSTELSPLVTIHNFKNDSLEKKMNSVGKVADHCEVKVIDKEGKLVPFGALGEICARGYGVMKGYWNDEEKTKEVIRDGWYHTGDIGAFTEDGYCTIAGRVKDMVIRGGENIYPKEIENHLIKNSKIFDAHAIGVPDARLGEEVCVWIKLKDNMRMTENEVRSYCREELANYKVPRYIRFVNDFPKTASGKIQKYLMIKEMEQYLQSVHNKTS